MKSTLLTNEFVVCREPHTGTLASGAAYVCGHGKTYRADSEEVRRNPQFFVAIGEELVPFERPEVDEPEPLPATKPKPRTLRSRRDWRGTVTVPGRWGMKAEVLHITLHAGRTVREDVPWVAVLSAKERKGLFEVVES